MHSTIVSLTRSLRALGGLAVAAAGGMFLLQGLDASDALWRGWLCLSLVAGAGIAAAVSLRAFDDAKSARLLFTIAAGLLTAQMAQVGGMIHELSATSESMTPYFAGVTGPGTLQVAIATLAAFAPVAFAAFSVLVRPERRQLTLYLLLGCATLWLPFREGLAGLVVVGALIGVFYGFNRGANARQPVWRTPEALVARGLVLLPAAIGLLRWAFHAGVGEAMTLTVFGLALCAWYRVSRTRALAGAPGADAWSPGLLLTVTHAFGVLCVAVGWMFGVGDLIHGWSSPFAAALIASPAAAFAYAESRRSESLSVVLAAFAALIQLVLHVFLLALGEGEALAAVLLLAAITGSAGVLLKDRVLTAAAILGSVLAAIRLAALVLSMAMLNAWVALAIAGIAVVVGASAIERHGASWLARLGRSDEGQRPLV